MTKRRGWCPGIWSPMESGDGFILRLRPVSEGLSYDQVHGLCALVDEHGLGDPEVTRRGNVQLRGAPEERVGAVQEGLAALALAPTDRTRESLPMVLRTPLDGLDLHCAPLGGIAANVEAVLTDERSRRMPPKFCIAVDGGVGGLEGLSADVWIQVAPDASAVEVRLAGAGNEPVTLGQVAAGAAHRALAALLDSYAAEISDIYQRMEALVAARGVGWARAAFSPWQQPTTRTFTRPPRSRLLGYHGQDQGWLGVGLPFGVGTLSQWRELARVARDYGDGRLRPTCSRTVVFGGVARASMPAITEALCGLGLMSEIEGALSHVSACTGAPRCASAHGETRMLAHQLARQLQEFLTGDRTLHVSGCQKGCAMGAAADLVVVRTASGTMVATGSTAASCTSAPVAAESVTGRVLELARGEGAGIHRGEQA